MTQSPPLYPATPVGVPDAFTQPSAGFRRQAKSVMGSIVLFFIVYLLLLLLAVSFIAACFYVGFLIITSLNGTLPILAALGIAGTGVMIFVFLVKFIFATTRYDQSKNILITEEDQPRLYAFLRQLTADTQTPFPKKIYLSPDVNAFVFYNSSFWSMFLPVRKNLNIGLGLVNAVNISEFKAVMAHEFGHFSQRSMKLGSVVYNVNKVIYNMLFENTGYSGFLSSWGSAHGVFALFAHITAGIAQGIQYVLRKMYGVVNKSYMALSREMEFHADAVAASVSGSSSLVSSLRRLEFANAGFEQTINKLNELYHEKNVTGNFFANHSEMLRIMARQHSLTLQYGLPEVTDAFLLANANTRINYKNQWASHPTRADREEHLNAMAIQAEINTSSAWDLFDNVEQLQATATKNIYGDASTSTEHSIISAQDFNSAVLKTIAANELPGQYRNFYDNRFVLVKAETLDSSIEAEVATSFEDWFSEKNAGLPKYNATLKNDIALLDALNKPGVQVKTFDFDGQKYTREQIPALILQLSEELKASEQQLERLDQSIIHYFLQLAKLQREDAYNNLRTKYVKYHDTAERSEQLRLAINSMMEPLSPIYSGTTLQIGPITQLISQLKNSNEPIFKTQLKVLIDDGVISGNTEQQERFSKYINSDYAYFAGDSFFEEELHILNLVAQDSWELISKTRFRQFCDILVQQLTITATHKDHNAKYQPQAT